MNVNDLRKALADLPGDMPVVWSDYFLEMTLDVDVEEGEYYPYWHDKPRNVVALSYRESEDRESEDTESEDEDEIWHSAAHPLKLVVLRPTDFTPDFILNDLAVRAERTKEKMKEKSNFSKVKD